MGANNLIAAESDLVNRLLENLPVGFDESKVKVPNGPFDTPKNDAWLRATLNTTGTFNSTATGCRQRTTGIFTVDVFYPLATGSLGPNQTAIYIQSLYNNRNFENVQCQEAAVLPMGEDGPWYHVQVNVDFYFEGLTNVY